MASWLRSLRARNVFPATLTTYSAGAAAHRVSPRKQSSRPVDEDLLGCFELGMFVGSFDELPPMKVAPARTRATR
jgi:hypothetical protein